MIIVRIVLVNGIATLEAPFRGLWSDKTVSSLTRYYSLLLSETEWERETEREIEVKGYTTTITTEWQLLAKGWDARSYSLETCYPFLPGKYKLSSNCY